ncbi:MAG: PAS domain S-box protein [Chloroflexi bacterium]|nr:PAS domain S-box protein [Chloroflexota bacterium]
MSENDLIPNPSPDELTKLRQRVAELENAEKRYLNLFENAGDAILIVDPVTFTIVDANANAARRFGYSKDELKRLQIADIEIPQDTHQSNSGFVWESFASGVILYECYYRRKDGSLMAVEVSRSYVVAGGQTLQQNVVRDITARKEMQAALHESEERLRSTFESLDDFVVVLDKTGLILDYHIAPHSGGFGLQVEIFKGRPYWELLPAEVSAMLDDHIQSLMDSGVVQEFDYSITEPPNQVMWFNVKISLRSDSEGGFAGVTIVFRDITERRDAEQQRLAYSLERERVKLLGDFITNVSHEFKTPLSVIMTKIYLMEKTMMNEKEIEKLRIIQEQVTYINHLISAMLMMSRLNTDSEFAFEPFELSGLVREVVVTAHQLAATRQQSIKLNLQQDSFIVLGKKEDVHHALYNLIENALLFSPNEATITVNILSKGNYVLLEIIDPGIGLSKEDVQFIFDPFYRVDKARTARKAGLGLSIAKKIIEIHKGAIEVTSTLGKGSTFAVYLPQINH